jgi:hypothetical protein
MKKLTLLLLFLYTINIIAQECNPIPLPYTEDFESPLIDLIPQCTHKEIIAGNSWFVGKDKAGTYNGNVLKYTPCYEQASAWFFSKPLHLLEGHIYTIEYLYGNDSPNATEQFKVALATKPAPSAATVFIKKHTVKGAHLNLEVNHEICVPVSGIYYIALKVVSAAYQGELYIDDLKVYE